MKRAIFIRVKAFVELNFLTQLIGKMNIPESNTNNSPTILIVDDDDINQRLIFYHLRGITDKMLFAANGREAINVYSENPDVCLILMDLVMPIMNGVEASNKIHEINPNVKIIALSAFREEENEYGSGETKFTGYLTKPVRKEVLIETVKKYLD